MNAGKKAIEGIAFQIFSAQSRNRRVIFEYGNRLRGNKLQNSRNRKAGYLIGQGKSMQEAMDEVGMIVEGVYSAKAAIRLAQKYQVELPIIEQVNKILFEDKKAADALNDLMLRDPKTESDAGAWK